MDTLTTNTIKSIITIEESTKEITREIEEKRENLNKIVEAKKLEVKTKIENETKETVKDIKTKALEECRRKIGEMTFTSQKNYANLEKEYEQNKEKWINEIFNSVISY